MKALDGRRRLAPLAAVVASHGLLLALMLQAGVWRDRGGALPAKPPLVVMLLRPTAPPPVAPAALPPAATAALPTARRPHAPRDEEHTIHLPAEATPIHSPETSAIVAPPLPEPAASAPLRLDLPRAAIRRSPTLDDPRANRVRPNLEARIAAALGGDGAWTEERVAEGVVRLRRGKECVEVRETRDVALDRFNQNFNNKPRSATDC